MTHEELIKLAADIGVKQVCFNIEGEEVDEYAFSDALIVLFAAAIRKAALMEIADCAAEMDTPETCSINFSMGYNHGLENLINEIKKRIGK